MRITIMDPIIRSTQRWNDYIMRPGNVGSVGDVNVNSKLKTSCTDLPRRMDPTFSGNKSLELGSIVQNGSLDDYNGGLGPRTIDTNWDIPRPVFPICNGWRIQNLQQPDNLVEPWLGELGDYSFRNKIARTFGRTTGFEELPGGYEGYGIPRGGQLPRIVDYDLGTSQSFVPSQ